MEQLADTGTFSRTIVVVALIAARLVPVFIVAPFFGGRLVPAPVRIAVAIAFAVLLLPVVGGPVDAGWAAAVGPLTLTALFIKEILVGTVLGFLGALPFFAADLAGRLSDTARGASMAQVLVPQTGEQTSPLGDLNLQLAIVIFLLLDGHLLFLRALGDSYLALPLMTMPEAAAWGDVASVTISATARMIAVSIGLAAPVLAAMFLTDLALGLINRVSPQVSVYFLGLPVKSMLGIFVTMLALGAVAAVIAGETIGGMRAIRQAVQVFAL